MTGQDAPGRGGPLIEVRGLRVDYGLGPDAVHAVIDADLTLLSGTVLGLAGESGSGKSTLAYAMTRLLRAPGIITGGQVLLHGGAGPVREEAVRLQHIGQLGADGDHRVERVHGALHHHRDVGPAELAQLALVRGEQVDRPRLRR